MNNNNAIQWKDGYNPYNMLSEEEKAKYRSLKTSAHTMTLNFSSDPLTDALQKLVGQKITIEIGEPVIKEPTETVDEDDKVTYTVEVENGVITKVTKNE